MPLGIERINARHQQPNSRIIFIKPLPGPTAAFAQDFLERIAAIVHPIMKANHLAITSLEEYEPNREFVGRNFNAGEVVQLVLRAPYSGHWLGFRSVQMVMIHELAHCAQMNHSAAFWKVRNGFAEERPATFVGSRRVATPSRSFTARRLPVAPRAESIGDQAKDAFKSAKGAVSKGAEKVEDAASDAASQAKKTAGKAGDKTEGALNKAGDKADDASGDAKGLGKKAEKKAGQAGDEAEDLAGKAESKAKKIGS